MSASNSSHLRPSKERIAREIISLLREMLQERGLPDGFQNEDRPLIQELGLSSMDALQLLANIDARLGAQLPFEKLLVLENGYRTEITVRQLTEFVDRYFQDLEDRNQNP